MPNPETLLPDDDAQEPLHNCSDLLESLTGVRPDLGMSLGPIPMPPYTQMEVVLSPKASGMWEQL